jgi:RNA polymerase sigma factor (sigma-70 family)
MAAPGEEPIGELVSAANRGDAAAWNQLVDRYSPLLVAVIRRFRLPPEAVDDVAQTVWLRLVEHLGELREPAALPKWIMTTGRREALRHVEASRRLRPVDPLQESWTAQASAEQPAEEMVMRAQRHEALLAGLAELGSRHRQLLLLLIHDPPLSYAEISEQAGIPVGAIGPTRARALARLRQTAPIMACTDEGELAGGDTRGRTALG